ncbi:hypothetical protein L1987_32314 [Smallanthus sonchifolius]|uniref:Uncharacterized protein n=1 Tax=Smallanthus sonchifolius TaxID=185202 RepID=A0ACB9I7U2_9ASTR|nr:hypothetical protein L1987_32314 [Smallanthus sonchifolius]
MDCWREYFGSANANIFEIIEGAIKLAAFDCPNEFKVRRDHIAQILFSVRLINCSGCNKQELALPVDDGDHDDDVGIKLADVNRNFSIESSKVINGSKNDVDGDHHVSNYSYGDAEALTDEIEQESQTFGEVMRIKEIVENSPDESASVLCNSLRKLRLMSISVETLKSMERYVSENTPESINPSVLDEEEGLPSPPLDDLAFLNPHSMSLELSEKFFDDVDDYGNPRKNENRNNRKPPPVEKHNVTDLKQQKQLNGPTMVTKPSVAKPCKPPVVDSTMGRLLNPNMDRKLQNHEKPILPKNPVVPQRKPMLSNAESVQDKLEATKRKLQERYQQAENVKRQRTIQVMELHDLPKQDVALKNQHTRPGHNHYKHWANNRF